MPQRRIASVTASALPTRYRVTAAAVPPRQLETIAISTPIASPIRFSRVQPSSAYAILSLQIVSATTSQVLMKRDAGLCREAALVARASRPVAARAVRPRRHLAAPSELSGAWAARAPSRQMVLRLADALDIPLRQHNALLLAAGFAPAGARASSARPSLPRSRARSDYMLAQQEPFPAVAVDRHWNLLKANGGAVRLVEFLVGPLPPGTPVNLADALVAPDVLRPYPRQLGGGGALLHPQRRGRRGCRRHRRDERAARPADRLPGRTRGAEDVATERPAGPVLPMHFRKGEDVACGCSPPSPPSARPRTSPRRSCASRASFPWTKRPRRSCVPGCPRGEVASAPEERFLGDERRALQQRFALLDLTTQ